MSVCSWRFESSLPHNMKGKKTFAHQRFSCLFNITALNPARAFQNMRIFGIKLSDAVGANIMCELNGKLLLEEPLDVDPLLLLVANRLAGSTNGQEGLLCQLSQGGNSAGHGGELLREARRRLMGNDKGITGSPVIFDKRKSLQPEMLAAALDGSHSGEFGAVDQLLPG